MPIFAKPQVANLTARAREFFVTRDFILHDGASLRRFSVAGRTQALVAGLAAVTMCFSAYGATRAASDAATVTGLVATPEQQVQVLERKVSAMQADVVAIRHAATVRAARVEQRQALLTAVLTGKGDRSRIAAEPPAVDPREARVAGEVVAPFERIERRQISQAATARRQAEQRLAMTTAHLRRLGLAPERLVGRGPAMGGPFEAVSSAEAAADIAADAQFRNLFMTWKKLDTLEQAVIAIPSLRPVDKLSFTSNFGIRTDPFRGIAAMHAGVDIPGPIGTPVYATADGYVLRAERSGGYGNLVELDHGKGLATRYGHLSRILVAPYERVRRGQLIALMGSTGRSTGSHLHYEVRIDGHAVNPVPFLQTADYLLGVQDRALHAQPVSGGATVLGGTDSTR